MLSINDLKNGLIVLIEGEPYQILEVKHLHMGRGGSSIQTRIRRLKTGQVLQKNFKPADAFEEADIEKRKILFIYRHRGEFVFVPKSHEATGTPAQGLGAEKENPKNRFTLTEEQVGEVKKWLKSNTDAEAVFMKEVLLTISVPIKMDFKVIAAPPGLRGDTAQGGTKMATIETGEKISVPLFINEGDVIRVNTQSGEYVERVNKATSH